MENYLLSWNPKKWGWSDYKDVIADINSFGFATYSWSCGNRKNINVGDRIFLIRQGIEPRGIIGSGWAATTPKEKPHWDQELAQEGKKLCPSWSILMFCLMWIVKSSCTK